jgi:hypothetical protein
MAEMLRIPTPNLRLIRARHEGVFPTQDIRKAIDGRWPVRGHGSREMPVWGLAFSVDGLDVAQEDEVRARIEALIHHLEALQEPATE